MHRSLRTYLVGGVLLAATSLLPAPRAEAVPLTFDLAGAPLSSVHATLGPSLCLVRCTIATTLNPVLDTLTFELDPGESATFDFFRISVGGFGGALGEITATLGFDSPDGLAVTGHGSGGFVTKFGRFSAGLLRWDDLPALITDADGAQFSVSLSDLTGFTVGNTAQVTATLTALRERTPEVVPPPPSPLPSPPTAVSEPGTLATVGVGLLVMLRRRLRNR